MEEDNAVWKAPGAAEVAPISSMASAMLFGTIIFATVAMAVRSYMIGDLSAIRAAQNPRSSSLEMKSFSSVYTLLHHSSILGLILFYAYLSEYHPPYPHSEKSYDRDEFFFLTALLILASFFTLSKHESKEVPVTETSLTDGSERAVAPADDATELLNRDQTEEWKGWMQFMFLLYHYYHAAEVYNSIRIMITCYVWMTGFGNFSFFYIKGDFSAVRVMQMLWRLNFLVLFLCLTQGTTYILYYICLLHTYFFLVVYAVMRVHQHVNYSKWGIRRKLLVLAGLIFLVWDVDLGIFKFLHYPFLGETPILGASSGSMWEWYFRSSLDHWSTFMGMIFALNFPITSLFFRKLEAQPLHLHILAKGAMSIVFIGMFHWWVSGPFKLDKLSYNETNPYFGCVPLLVYIFFRNLTPYLRGCTLELLHQIGKTTLETYLMQHHIWLTSNAKSLLTLIPGWPKMNFLVVTCLYFLFSRRLYQLTLFLRGMLLPNDRDTCYRNMVLVGFVLCGFLMLAFFMNFLGVLHLTSVAVVSVVLGYKLYDSVVKKTWIGHATSPTTAKSDDTVSSKKWEKVAPPAMACVAILLLGMVWQRSALSGAGKIEPLPASCSAFLNDGIWVTVDSCDEEIRGEAYRNSAVEQIGTCPGASSNFVWGWTKVDPSTHCRFQYRNAKDLKKTLAHRRISFVGDSVVRSMYHAFARQLGENDAGAFDTSIEKHSDHSRTLASSIQLDFKWSPNITDHHEVLRDLLKKGAYYPDVLFLGGGAWDCLHSFQSNSEKTALRTSVNKLNTEIANAKEKEISVGWIVPTTINTAAVSTIDSKKEKLTEERLQEVRELVESAGILKVASVVIDGTSFSSARVAESYDGVHYPFAVYDAGAQIIANTMDWLLIERDFQKNFTPNQPGKMAHPLLGLAMLLVAMMGIFLFDGFTGISYLAAPFVPSVMPLKLYEEAFTSLHRKLGLPDVDDSETFGVVDSLWGLFCWLVSLPGALLGQLPRFLTSARTLLFGALSQLAALSSNRSKANDEGLDETNEITGKNTFGSPLGSPIGDGELDSLIASSEQSSSGDKEG